VNKSRSSRSLAGRAAIYLATLATASALTGVFAGPAAADPDPVPPATAGPSSSAPAPESGTPAAPPVESSQPAAPKPPAAAVKRAQLDVALVFGKPSYRTDEDVTFTFKVTNVGSGPVTGLWVFQSISDPTDLVVPYEPGWGPLRNSPGVTIEPGATYELPVTGKVRDTDATTAVVHGILFDGSGAGAGEFSFSTPITKVTGHAAGVVFGDGNGNGVFDAGEQLAGVPLSLRYVNGSRTYPATSDADGKFDFGDVPAAEYNLGGEVLDGWLFPWTTLHIGPDTDDLLVRGAPPLNGALHASMAFTQDSYRAGDLAHVTVTLANSGTTPLTGIVAACNRVGDSYLLQGTGPGWGDLVWSRGVTIAPGETRNIDVTETVPEAAVNRGFVAAACDFGYREVDIENHAQARDQAAVPGGRATVAGDVAVFDDQGHVQQGVAGARVVLVSDQACPVTGERTTDANGHFEFLGVAPGPEYRLYVLPPQGWRIKSENPASLWVRGPETDHGVEHVEAEQGDAPLPTVPAQPPGCGEAPTPTSTTGAAGGTGGGRSGGGSGGLASTGVDVLGLGVLTLAALGLGTGLVLSTRRRRGLTG
jgi:hypothetical protein